jgi:hypothetical protein
MNINKFLDEFDLILFIFYSIKNIKDDFFFFLI